MAPALALRAGVREGEDMAEILGLGCTHRPVMVRRDEDWTFALKAALNDPDMPEAWKDPARWPEQMRAELGSDFGLSAAGRFRQIFRRNFAEARRALDAFQPDVVIMWGDDQYENFKEDLIPPFAVLAYEDQTIHPWQAHQHADNPWREPVDMAYRIPGHREAGKYLVTRLIQEGFDMPYAYRPLHDPLSHAFTYTILLLDDERNGFNYPVIPFSVNCYGRRVNAARGLRLPLSMRDKIQDLDPPSPNPARCMEVGAATARIMAESPWRTALVASSSWSHSFLTEKNYQLWPDVDADRRLYQALVAGDYDTWRRTTTDQIEDTGQHEVLNWFCLAGAMEELGRVPDHTEFIESYAFVCCAVFAYYFGNDMRRSAFGAESPAASSR
jgi:hypothetical protein